MRDHGSRLVRLEFARFGGHGVVRRLGRRVNRPPLSRLRSPRSTSCGIRYWRVSTRRPPLPLPRRRSGRFEHFLILGRPCPPPSRLRAMPAELALAPAPDPVLREAGARPLRPSAFAALVLHLTARQLKSSHHLTL